MKRKVFCTKEEMLEYAVKTGDIVNCSCFISGEIFRIKDIHTTFTGRIDFTLLSHKETILDTGDKNNISSCSSLSVDCFLMIENIAISDFFAKLRRIKNPD